MASLSTSALIADYLVPAAGSAAARAVASAPPTFLDASWHMPNSGRSAPAEFQTGHIPGARFFDLDEVKDETRSLPHMLPTASRFRRACAEWNLRPGAPIVVYDNADMLSSSRAWFTFTVFGIPNVFVLSGGLPLWKQRSLPLATGPSASDTDEQFEAPALSFRPSLVRSLDDMKRNLESGEAQVVDARPWSRFSGQQSEPRPGLGCGHIPGAINVPWTSILDRSQGFARFADQDVIRQKFVESGVEMDGDRKIILTCGSGVTASVLLVGLRICQIPLSRLSLYDGSWSEWGDLSLGLPIAKSTSCRM